MSNTISTEALARQRRNALVAIALFFAATLAITIYTFSQFTRHPTPQLTMAVFAQVLTCALDIAALVLAWRGRHELGVWLAIVPAELSIVVSVASIAGISLAFALAAIVLVTVFVPAMLPTRQSNALLVVTIMVSVGILLLDVALQNTQRTTITGFGQFIGYSTAGLALVLGYGLYRQRDFYLQAYRASIRSQFSTLMTVLTLASVATLGVALVSFAASRTRDALQASALAQLESVRAVKREQLTAYFTERSGNIQLNSGTQATREALASFSDGFSKSNPETIRNLYLGKIEQADAGDGSAFTAAHIQYTPYLSSIVKTFGFYDVFVISRNGQVVYTYAKEDDFGTNLVSGKYVDTNLAEVYRKALQLPAGEVAVSDFEFYAPSANAPASFIAAPIYDSGQVVGVLAAQLPVDRISAIMQERTGLGETGETYLVGDDLLFRSESRFAENTLLTQKVDTTASNEALAGETRSAVILDYRGISVFSSWEPFVFKDLHWAFLAEIDEAEALAPADRLANLLVGVGVAISLAIALIAVLVATGLARAFSNPVINLTQTAQTISGGNFDVEIETGREDELGTLAGAFRVMVNRVRELIAGLEKRSAELATVAEVGTATATILETNRLLQEVVDLTKERFDLYHSHIYLLDEEGRNLVLTAGAGEPGRQMVKEGRSIPLDREQSLVARSARERKGVTVNDVTQAPDFLPNPLLPDTRSELAAPMIVGGNVIGVFDVQSDRVGRFTEADVNIQTTLAAQLATSIQNVRSFEQAKTQADYEALVNAIGQKIQRAATMEETLQTAARELGLALGASRVKASVGRTDGVN